MKVARDDLLYGLLKIRQPDEKEGLRVNLDTILLAHFARPKRGERILELGCAHGAVSLILAKRGHHVEGVDIQPHLIELARENAEYNRLSDFATFKTADLRDYKMIWGAQSFDRIVVNPPYDELGNANVSPSESVAVAAQGAECRLSDVIEASRFLLKNRGRIDIVIRADRAGDLFALLDRFNIAPKVVLPVYPKPKADAFVILTEAVRAAGKGVKIKAPLFVLDADGKETPEVLEAYKL